jgi:valyl-tRNA synthetase
MPFMTEEIWHLVKERKENDCIIVSAMPVTEEADKKIPWLFRALSEIPGYFVGWDYHETEEPKKWSEEAKKKVRRKRFEKRVRKNFPLFAEEMIAQYRDSEEKQSARVNG